MSPTLIFTCQIVLSGCLFFFPIDPARRFCPGNLPQSPRGGPALISEMKSQHRAMAGPWAFFLKMALSGNRGYGVPGPLRQEPDIAYPPQGTHVTRPVADLQLSKHGEYDIVPRGYYPGLQPGITLQLHRRRPQLTSPRSTSRPRLTTPRTRWEATGRVTQRLLGGRCRSTRLDRRTTGC